LNSLHILDFFPSVHHCETLQTQKLIQNPQKYEEYKKKKKENCHAKKR
jgi:hypothetical protein